MSPYKSKSQARALHAKAARGEIPEETVEEFDQATDFSELPEKVAKKKSSKFKKYKKAIEGTED